MGSVYLYNSDKRYHLKQNILQLYIVIIFLGYGGSLFSQNTKARIEKIKKWTKKTVFKKLNFLPYIEYKPSILPSENAKTLLKDLNIYEKIINDHVQFEKKVDEQLRKERDKRTFEDEDMLLYALFLEQTMNTTTYD